MRFARPRLLLVSIALVGSLVWFAPSVPAADTSSAATAAPQPVPPELARFNDLLAGLAERLNPGLVHLSVRRLPAEAERGDKGDETPPDNPHGAPPFHHPRRSSGSGFVIDATGLVVTNAHVVEDADKIEVRLADGRRFAGTVVGRDDRVDLAIVRIAGATGLTVLSLGDSNRLRVGEFVLALGHPFGLEHSVSFGIVSRKGDPINVATPGFDFIQTDAAINPGNSGGPLVNMAGEVVGVNSMAARNGSIGFAIPSNLVKALVPQLVAKGKVEWGWLGVSIGEMTDEDIDRLKLAGVRGVLVRSVMEGEPAAQAGIRPNDVILAVDGTSVSAPRDLQRLVSITPVGKRIHVRVLRDGHPTELEVTVGLYHDPERAEK